MPSIALGPAIAGCKRISIRVALFTGIGMLAALLVIAAAQRFGDALGRLQDARDALAISECTDHLMEATVNWAYERGVLYTALSSGDTLSQDERQEVVNKRNAAEKVLVHFRDNPLYHSGFSHTAHLLDQLLEAHDRVSSIRIAVDAAAFHASENNGVTPAVWFDAVTDMVMAAQRISLALREHINSDTELARALTARDAGWALAEFAGRERGLASGIIAAGRAATPDELLRLGLYRGWTVSTLQIVDRLRGSAEMDPALDEAMAAVQLAFGNGLNDRRAQLRPLLLGEQVDTSAGQQWFSAATGIIEAAVELQRVASSIGQREAERRSTLAIINAQVDFATVVVAVLLGAFGLFFVAYRVVGPIRRLTQAFDSLAAGTSDVEIPESRRQDEIGTMSQAIRAFKATMIERYRLEEEVRHRRQIEVDLRRATKAAEAANTAKSRFLANVSHELRTPLNAVIGFADALEREYPGPLNEKQREYVDDIHRSGRHLLALIEDVLDISKAESGEWKLHEEVLRVKDAMDHACSLVQSMVGKHEVRLVQDLMDDDISMQGDLRQIVQMLTNLLTNAIRFTHPGGQIRLSGFRREDDGIRLSVSDTGIGMSEAEISIAMELFGQIRKGKDLGKGGTGLGLPLVQRMAEHHGATMHIESIVDVGTTVTLDFPPERSIV
jgi:signal transduction histidine kinase